MTAIAQGQSLDNGIRGKYKYDQVLTSPRRYLSRQVKKGARGS